MQNASNVGKEVTSKVPAGQRRKRKETGRAKSVRKVQKLVEVHRLKAVALTGQPSAAQHSPSQQGRPQRQCSIIWEQYT